MERRMLSVVCTAAALAFLFANYANADLIRNGRFDTPDISGSWQTFNSSPPGFGWAIVSDGRPHPSPSTGIIGVDVNNTVWSGVGGTINADGNDQSLDIDGASSISQGFPTIVGQEYTITFHYSHNPSGSSATAGVDIVGDSMLVSETLTHDAPNSLSNMLWEEYSQTFVADSMTTTLTVQGVSENSTLGFAVDNFHVATSDGDGDGVLDADDNCTKVQNSAQIDTDGDEFGNVCDPDIAIPNDCRANFADLQEMKLAFFSTPADANWNADADLTGGAAGEPDGTVNFADLQRMKALFLGPPGPSGTAVTCQPQ